MSRGKLLRHSLAGLLIISALLLLSAACGGGSKELILATTTSTQDSGLLDTLIPAFEDATGYEVKTISVGSGQAMAMGEKGEADVLLVHSPDAEDKFMTAGHGVERRLVMHNDFVIVGPPDDPARIASATSAIDALKNIASSQSPFLSRGDQSGTHALEQKLWKQAQITPSGSWYQELGQGMGQTLTVASDKKGYTISDRATFLAQEKNVSLKILEEGDSALFNIYHVIVVNPAKSDKINEEGAREFTRFITSSPTQDIIRKFGVEKYGQPLFVPDAHLEAIPTSSPAKP